MYPVMVGDGILLNDDLIAMCVLRKTVNVTKAYKLSPTSKSPRYRFPCILLSSKIFFSSFKVHLSYYNVQTTIVGSLITLMYNLYTTGTLANLKSPKKKKKIFTAYKHKLPMTFCWQFRPRMSCRYQIR